MSADSEAACSSSPNTKQHRQFLFDSSTDTSVKGLHFVFDKDIFYTDNFDLDSFIVEHKKRASLEKLRDDLVAYHRVLTNSLIELINQDYADFVNLSTNLVGLDKALNTIQCPVTLMKEQITHVLDLIGSVMNDISEHLKSRHLTMEKESMQRNLSACLSLIAGLEKWLRISEISSSADLSSSDTLLRAGQAFIRLKHLLSKCKSHQTLENLRTRITHIEEVLRRQLDTFFMESLSLNDKSMIRAALSTYLCIEQVEQAEAVYRGFVVSSFVEQEVVASKQMPDTADLEAMYSLLVDFCQKQSDHWQSILDSGDQNRALLESFDFILNSVFPEISETLISRLSFLFNPGNPQNFHARYTITQEKLIKPFEALLRTPKRLSKFRNGNAYHQLKDKFNLAVYFQIRFHEATSTLDTEFQTLVIKEVFTDQCLLTASSTTLQVLDTLWHKSVYIPALLARFWKSSLQVLARFAFFIQSLRNKHQSIALLSTENEVLTVHLVLCLVSDCSRYGDLIQSLYLSCIHPKLSDIHCTDNAPLQEALQVSIDKIVSNAKTFDSLLVSCLFEQSQAYIRSALDVPRSYRKTNRDLPTSPSSYMVNLVSVVPKLLAANRELRFPVPEEHVGAWVSSWSLLTLPPLHSSLEEVLTSVRKMEES